MVRRYRPSSRLFDLEASRKSQASGIKRVLNNNKDWARRVGIFIRVLPLGWKGIAEDIRILWSTTGGDDPKSPNAWGGVIQGAVRRGELELTGERLPMTAKASHARLTDEYRRTSIRVS
jgi:hypothetical protein